MNPRRWLTTLALILTLTACIPSNTTNPVVTSPTAPDNTRTAYILCTHNDTSPATQDRCQRHIWGDTFTDDDPRWDCLHMGNRVCAPTTITVATTTS
jgi:hypothetical protein